MQFYAYMIDDGKAGEKLKSDLFTIIEISKTNRNILFAASNSI